MSILSSVLTGEDPAPKHQPSPPDGGEAATAPLPTAAASPCQKCQSPLFFIAPNNRLFCLACHPPKSRLFIRRRLVVTGQTGSYEWADADSDATSRRSDSPSRRSPSRTQGTTAPPPDGTSPAPGQSLAEWFSSLLPADAMVRLCTYSEGVFRHAAAKSQKADSPDQRPTEYTNPARRSRGRKKAR